MKKKVEIHHSIENKKSRVNYEHGLSPTEALIHTLNIMDFFAALRKDKCRDEVEDDIDWIELKFGSDEQRVAICSK